MKLRDRGPNPGTLSEQPDDLPIDEIRSCEVQLISKPLGRGERGAVLAMLDRAEGNDDLGRYRPADLVADLTMPLLFFERLDVPNGRMHGRPAGSLADDVLEAHVQRSFVEVSGNPPPDLPEGIAFRVYEKLIQRDPGAWTIWEQGGQDLFPEHELGAGLGFRLQLQRAFIVPSRELPMDEILDFRRRYRDDLGSLRLHLDDLCAKIAASGHDLAAIRTEVDRFDNELSRYTRSAAGWNNRKAVADLSISMNWAKAAGTAGILSFAGQVFTNKLEAATGALALLSGLAAGLKVETSAGLKRDEIRSPFRYFGAIRHELG